MNEIRRRLDGYILYNNGDNGFGRGVAILIKENSDISCKIIYKDNSGKCIAIEMEYEEKKVVVVNVHAQNRREKENILMFYRDFKEV